MENFRNGLAKILAGFVGWLVVLLGIILLPLPGPGWLTIFVGLSILAKHNRWARRLKSYGQEKYRQWRQWITIQPLWLKAMFWLITVLSVVVLLWFANVYSIIDTILSLDKDWLSSPFL